MIFPDPSDYKHPDSSMYVFGQQIVGLAGVTSIMLLAEAIAFAIAGLVFFRHRKNMLVQRAEAAFPSPIIATQLN
jgi:hypothetical protein